MSLSIRPPTPPHSTSLTHTASRSVIADPATAAEDHRVFTMVDVMVLLGFPLRALRRRKALAIGLWVAVVALTGLVASLLPRHYQAQTKFAAQKNIVMPSLNNPRRTVPGEAQATTKSAMDIVMRRENLIEIIREANLLATWPRMRTPLGRVKDAIDKARHREPSDSDVVNAMVGMLQSQMWVSSDDDAVTIGVDWGDPQAAYRIVQAAQQNFFDERHVTEVSMIGESIAILEGHVETARQAIQDAVSQINTAAHRNVRSAPTLTGAPTALQRANAGAIVTLQGQLAVRRQAIADLESSRNQRLQALQQHLAELRNTLGAAHPEIASTQESIRAVSTDSPQLAQLRADERSLVARLTALGMRPGDAVPAATGLEASLARATLDRLSRVPVDSVEDPQITYAKSQLKIATTDYEDLLGRLSDARIEMETARAAFKYRYNVITPPMVPRKSIKPKVPLLMVGGAMLGVFLGIFAAVALDLLSGRMIERWQVDRQLGLPVLADVQLP